MSQSSDGVGGLGILSVLGVCFVVLKLTGIIHWSWWFVTLPFWGGLAVVLTVIGIEAIFVTIQSSRGKL